MFATIVGPAPARRAGSAARPDAGAATSLDEALDDALGVQLAAGLGIVSTGRCDDPLTTVPATIAAAWRDATDRIARIAGVAGVPPVPVRHAIVGPCSMPHGGSPADAVPDAAIAAVRSALAALAAEGALVVALEEPWLGTPAAATDAGRARALAAWTAALDGCPLHVLLVAPGMTLEPFGAPTLAAAPVSSVALDLLAHPDDWRVAAGLPGDRGLVLCIGETRPGRVVEPAVLVWAAGYAASMHGRGLDRVALAPSAGLEAMAPDAAALLLEALADAARIATLPPTERAQAVDPRMVSARSAALGHAGPARRRPRPGEGGER